MKVIFALVLFIACASQVYSGLSRIYPTYVDGVSTHCGGRPFYHNSIYGVHHYNPHGYNWPYFHGGHCGCGSCPLCLNAIRSYRAYY